MNIVFLNSMPVDAYGGGEKWMLMAGSGLAARGHNVIYACRPDSLMEKAVLERGLHFHPTHYRRDFSPLQTMKLAGFFRSFSTDIVICNFNKDVRVGGLAAKLAGVKRVFARHGVALCKDEWKYRIPIKLLTDGIITNTDSIKQQYTGYGWLGDNDVKVLYNGVIPPKSEEVYQSPEQFRGRKMLLAAGRMTHQKGFDVLLESVSILAKSRDDFFCLILGEGPLRPELEAQMAALDIGDYVLMPGFRKDLSSFYNATDIFVLSSRFEGMANVVLESMSLGVPVVATSVNGMPELITHGESGLLVESDNAEALAGQIQYLLDNPDIARTFGATGKKQVETNFSVNKMVDNLERFLEERLNGDVGSREHQE